MCFSPEGIIAPVRAWQSHMAHMSDCCSLPLGATSSRWTRSLCTAEYLTVTAPSLLLWSGSPAGGHAALLQMYVVLGFLLSIEIYSQHLYTSIFVWVSYQSRLNESKHLCDSSFLHPFIYFLNLMFLRVASRSGQKVWFLFHLFLCGQINGISIVAI